MSYKFSLVCSLCKEETFDKIDITKYKVEITEDGELTMCPLCQGKEDELIKVDN